MASLRVHSFFDPVTFTVSYVVADSVSKVCAVIDPVLDYDSVSGRTGTRAVDEVIEYLRAEGLSLQWILETHAHADHVSAGFALRKASGGKLGIGARIADVQAAFAKIFNIKDLAPDGRQFDHLFADGEEFAIGGLRARAMHTPGHTPACVTYVIEDAAFVGDTMFMPDYGSARADFPGGDARSLYRSVRRILALPEATRIYCCHDYKAPGRAEFVWETTVGAQRRGNIHIRDGVTEEAFVAMRTARDKTLSMPQLLVPAIQINIRAGELPPAEDNGVAYLKVPLNRL